MPLSQILFFCFLFLNVILQLQNFSSSPYSEIISGSQIAVICLLVWRVKQLENAVKKIQDHCWLESTKFFDVLKDKTNEK